MSKTAKAAVKAPVDADAANRREIIRTIKGPGVERIVQLIPAFASFGDPYGSVMKSPDLLWGCLQLFRKEREKFQDLLVDAAGNPVTDDTSPLRCGRSVDQVIGMVVRSGCKAYVEARWGDDPAAKPPQPAKAESKGLLDKLRALVKGNWTEAEIPKPAPNAGEKFYAAIKDHLEYDWQVPLIPYFAELPVKLLIELGRGCTTLRNPEAIAQLADIGRHNMDQARKILADDMMREMLDTQPLAAKGVSFLGKERYDFLHGAVYEQMGEKFWNMCVDCDRLEAMEVQNAKDLAQMAEFLHIISAETINQVVRLLQYAQMPVFLSVAYEKLGEEMFTEIFGVPGKKKLIKVFCEKTAAYKLDPNEPIEDLKRRLPDIFAAYMRSPADFEKGL